MDKELLFHGIVDHLECLHQIENEYGSGLEISELGDQLPEWVLAAMKYCNVEFSDLLSESERREKAIFAAHHFQCSTAHQSTAPASRAIGFRVSIPDQFDPENYLAADLMKDASSD
jgi:hypothetical protein